MTKKTIITILLALVAVAGQAKKWKTIKTPEAMVCVNVRDGELKPREVIFSDTATTIHFTMEYPKEQYFCFVKTSYLIDENGIRYPLRSAEGIALDAWVQSPKSGVTDFTMNFEPMPKEVQVFDFIEGDVRGAFMLLGIHDKKYQITAPTLQQLYDANAWTLPSDWLHSDTITIRGRIEGYNAERFGFTAMECYMHDVMEKNNGTLLMEIAPDGTFEKKFPANYPVCEKFTASEEPKTDFYQIPFFARPGETVDITVRQNERGQYECYYNSDSSKDVERWLKSDLRLSELGSPIYKCKGNFNEANTVAEQVWENMLSRIDMVSRRNHFTPMETHLALANMQCVFGLGLLDYAMLYSDRLTSYQQQENGSYKMIVTDSVGLQSLADANNYRLLRRIDFDNPILMMGGDYYFLVNRMQFAKPVREAQFQARFDEDNNYYNDEKHGKQVLTMGYDMMRTMMGSDHDNLMAQLCAYKNMQSDFNGWRQLEEAIPSILTDTTLAMEERQKIVAELETTSRMYPFYLSTFTHPYVHQKAEQFYQEQMAQAELTSPLPDGPGAEIIRDIMSRYPNRYIVIDFWGMGCGPCRAAIQSSKNRRAEIAQRDDIKLVFIAGEQTTEGSVAYRNYVSEWLAGEETICVTNADFIRLQELFRFSGIPHYETITPEGRRVRDDLRIHEINSYDIELKLLKEKLN